MRGNVMKLGQIHKYLKMLDKLERKFQFHQNDALDLPSIPDINSARKNKRWIKWENKNARLVQALQKLRDMEV
jgi:hypothetical protein